MTAVELPVIGLARKMAELRLELDQAMRDRTWKLCPVGRDVERYLRSLRWGAHPSTTLSAYEQVLGLMALRHAHFESLAGFCSQMGTEYLREFLDAEWGSAAANTKKQRTSIIRSFFRWATTDGRIPFDPARDLKAPRGSSGRATRQAYDLTVLHKLVSGQDTLRDQCALQLLCRLGLRKNELRLIQMRHIDLVRDLIYVQGKGGKDELLPIVGGLRTDLYLYLQTEQRHPDEFLLYPRSRKRSPMDSSSIHRWFKACLERAGLPDTIQTHEMRHSAADAIYRLRGDVSVARMLLRHEHLSTTQTYLHPLKRDLTDALRSLDEAWGA